MPKYRDNLPQLSGDLYLTDAGLETILIFNHNYELPCFAAFPLLENEKGYQDIREYYKTMVIIANKQNCGAILDAPTWRASKYWGGQLGYACDKLIELNKKAVELLCSVRDELDNGKSKIVVSGCIGSPADAYNPQSIMTAEEAKLYHSAQIKLLSETEADMITAMTMTYPDEAIGITKAAKEAGIPVSISFTVETDGKLPMGMSLKEAIETVDSATDNGPIYYMINCAHPTHFADVVQNSESWTQRIHGARVNASCKSHAELDESTELDDGNPQELGQQCAELRKHLTNLNVLGGCCGTDERHIKAIGESCQQV